MRKSARAGAARAPVATVEPEATSAPPRSVRAAIFLISAATLLFQVAFIRIFSASIWYHFAFLVVSVALFGFGASGVALALVPDRAGDAARRAAAPALFAITAIVAYLGTVAVPFSPFLIAQDPVQILYFLIYDLLMLVPFFCSGSAVALILRDWPARAARLYALDLVGAACGTLLLFLALAAALSAVAAVLLAPSTRMRLIASTLLAAVVPLVLWPQLLPDIRLDRSKAVVQIEQRPGAKRVFSAWSALARIDVIEQPAANPMIFIDAAAATPVAPPQRPEAARADLSALAFELHPTPSVAVIGPGGGIDVQNALALGAREVTAVEINPVIIDLVTRRYRDFTGSVFLDPRVHLVRDEGRSFVARSRRKFDILQITLIDTWAASVSGAYSLSENYLYTTEAFASYLEHLESGGSLAITRWYYEMPRLVSLARAALERLGVRDPARHVAVVGQSVRSVLIVQREPFSPAQIAALRAFASQPGRRMLHDPDAAPEGSVFDALLLMPDPRPLIESSEVALDPVTDDSPFFFQLTRWKSLSLTSLRNFTPTSFLDPLALPVGQLALVTALAIGLLLSVGLLGVPLALGAVPKPGRWRWLGYFLALGIAYIVVEVVLMQRLALLLGHPTYSVTAVLFAILLFSGLGSAWSDRWRGSPGALGRFLAVAIPAAILFVTFAVPPITRALMGLPLGARMLSATLVIAPLAFLMGVPFPLGIRVLGSRGGGTIPWAWAANGCGSVLGSVCAVLGAMLWNFSVMLLAAGALYALALAGISRVRERLA
jgi:spermidine synthase